MRTPPAKFLTDFDSGKDIFFAIKLVSDAKTRYWVTNKSSFTLWDTTAADGGHTALTKDAGQIAGTIDGQEEAGISEIQWGVDLSRFGGGVGQISSFSFTILNQEQMNVSLDAENFIHQPVSLYMGYVDTSTGTGLGDMVQIGTFMVDNIEPYHYARLVFSCVDKSMFIANTLLPKKLITKASHPRAPEESIGKPLPILYGDFQTFQTELVYGSALLHKHFEEYDLVPTIVTNFSDSTFASNAPTYTIAGHTCFSLGAAFYFGGEVIGEISSSGYTFANTTYAGFDIPKEFYVTWYIIPDSVVSGLTTAVEDSDNQFDYIKDKLITVYKMPETGGASPGAGLFFTFSRFGDGTLKGLTFPDVNHFQFWAQYILISGSGNHLMKVAMRDNVDGFLLGFMRVYPGNSGQVIQVEAYWPDSEGDFTWQNVAERFAVGFGSASETMAVAWIQHIVLVFKSAVVLKFASPTNIAVRGGAIRGGRG